MSVFLPPEKETPFAREFSHSLRPSGHIRRMTLEHHNKRQNDGDPLIVLLPTAADFEEVLLSVNMSPCDKFYRIVNLLLDLLDTFDKTKTIEFLSDVNVCSDDRDVLNDIVGDILITQRKINEDQRFQDALDDGFEPVYERAQDLLGDCRQTALICSKDGEVTEEILFNEMAKDYRLMPRILRHHIRIYLESQKPRGLLERVQSLLKI